MRRTVRGNRWAAQRFLLFSGCAIVLLNFGLRYAFGVFVAPVSLAMGWGREVFSLAIALQNLCWGFAQPVAGAIADRYGIRRLLWGGPLLFALALIGSAFARSPLEMYLLLGVLAGVSQAGFSLPLIASWFGRVFPEERRSQAIGIATAASSGGQFLLVPLVQASVTGWGWQSALCVMAALAMLTPFLGMPLAGSGTPSETTATAKTPADGGLALGPTLCAALRDSNFRLLLAGFFVCGFHVTFIIIHLPPYLLDLGLSASLGGWAVSVIGLFNIIGSWGAGQMGSRYSPRRLLCALYACRGVCMTLFLLLPPSPTVVLVFAATMGLLWLGTIPLTSGLVVTLCGTRHLSTLFGVVFLAHQVGAFLGVWLGGLLSHWSEGYEAIWWGAVLLSVVAALLHWPIQERRLAWAPQLT